jgi:N-acetylglucosaminyldiphosphoundecaprenol N-acetyl-beta-D-mannosaminyltransferase
MERFDFLGVKINATNPSEVMAFLKHHTPSQTEYVCFPDSFVIKESQRNAFLRSILNASLLTLPDGKPSQWFANLCGYKNVKTVSGYTILTELLNTEKTHYFYGANPAQLSKLKAAVEVLNPKARVLGYSSPPMLDLDEIAHSDAVEADLIAIKKLQPDCVWIGISSPKQDYLMQRASGELHNTILFGVGGVFNYIIDPNTKSPEWMKKLGLRWLYRAAKEPKRLAGKYTSMLGFLILNSPKMMVNIIRVRIKGRKEH